MLNETNNKIYILSGLGADERAFQLMDLSFCNPTFIRWITPRQQESIEHYASRVRTQITSEKPVLIGLSFGGMMAVEIAKQIETTKVILIASAKTKNELPFYYKLAGKFGLHHLLPVALLKSSNALTNWAFGATTTFEKALLKQILGDTDSIFLKWAIHQIVHWKNTSVPANTSHLHGTADRILPIRFVKADKIIPGGGHLMTLNKAEEIGALLSAELISN